MTIKTSKVNAFHRSDSSIGFSLKQLALLEYKPNYLK
jgi:hypothetical protein